jgi:ABC-2 type transport system ATP-binding protein
LWRKLVLEVCVESVSKRYGKVLAVDDVTLSLSRGVTCLLGRNGAGKSTLVRQMVGVENPSLGSVRLLADGKELDRKGRNASMGWLPQAFGYPPRMKVRDYVEYAAWLKGCNRRNAALLANSAIAQFDLIDNAGKRLGELSGGLLRRAGLAAATVHDPEGLILDEPTAGLDPFQRVDLHERVKVLGKKTTVLVATHLLEDVNAVADRILILDSGQSKWAGTRVELAAVGGSATADVESLREGLVALVGRESE